MGALKNLNIAGQGPMGKEHYGHPNAHANPNTNPLHPNAGGGGQWNHGPPPAPGPPYQPHMNAHPLPVRPPPAKEKEKKDKDKDGKGFKLKNIFKSSSKKGSSSPAEDPVAAARRGFGTEPAGYHARDQGGSSGHGYYQGAEQQEPPYAQGGPQPGAGAGSWDQPGRNAYYNHSDGSTSSHGSRQSSRGASFDQGPGGYAAPQHLRQHDYLAGGGSAHGRGGYGGRAAAEPRLPAQQYYEEEQEPPEDLLCLISGLLMAEPVIVPSGATYEKRCFEAWYKSGQRYCLHSNVVLESCSFFPNIGVAKRIATWCQQNQRRQPDPPSPELAGIYVQRILGGQASSGNDAHSAGTAGYMAAPSMGAGARGPRSVAYLNEAPVQQVYVAPIVPGPARGPRSDPYLVEVPAPIGPGAHGPPVHVRHSSSSSDDESSSIAAPIGPGARGPRADAYLVKAPVKQESGAPVGPGARGPRSDAYSGEAQVQQEYGEQESGKQEYGEQEYGEQEYGEQEYGEQENGEQEYGEQEYGEQEYGEQEYGEQEYGAPIGTGAPGPRSDAYFGDPQVQQEYIPPIGPGARGPRSDAYLGEAQVQQEYVAPIGPGARGPRSDAYLGKGQVQQEYVAPIGPGARGPPVHARHSSSSSDEESHRVAAPIRSAARDPRSDAYFGEAPVQQEYVAPIGPGARGPRSDAYLGEAQLQQEYVAPIGPGARGPPVRARHSSSSSDEESSRVAAPIRSAARDRRSDVYLGEAPVQQESVAPIDQDAHGPPVHIRRSSSSSDEESSIIAEEPQYVFRPPPVQVDPHARKPLAVGLEFSPPADMRDTYGHGAPEVESPYATSHGYSMSENNGDANDVPEPETSFPDGYANSGAESYHQPQAETYYTGDEYAMPESGGGNAYLPESELPEDSAGGLPQEDGFKASLTLNVPELSGRRPSASSEPGSNFRPPSLVPPHFSGDSDRDSPRSDSSGDTPRSQKHGSVHRPVPLFGPTSWNSGSATDSVLPTAPSGSGPERPTSDFARVQIARSQYGLPPADGVSSGPPSGSLPDSQSVRGQYGLPAGEGPPFGSLGSRGSHPFSGPHSGSSSGPPSGSFPAGLHRSEESEPAGRPPRFSHSSSWLPSDRSQDGSESGGHSLPLPLNTVPTSYSDRQSPRRDSTQEPFPDVVQKLYARHPKEQEEGAAEIRMLTRDSVDNRIALCSGELTDRVLGGLMELLPSRHPGVQVNAVAAIMNLSLEKENKLKIARAGVIPHLIDLLQRGAGEAQEIAAGAMFSLSLNDENKMAIGVLGGIPHLVQILRAGRPGARRDAAMALYHLSFVQMNRTKLVRAGGVNSLLQIAQENQSDLVSRALLILSHLALIPEGRASLSEMSNILTLVALLKGPIDGGSGEAPGETWAEVREHAAAALYQLSNHNMRFRSQVMQAGAEEHLVALASTGTTRARQKASALLRIMRDTPGQDGGRQPAYPVRGRYNGRDQDQNSALF